MQTYWRLDCFPKPLVALLDGPLTPTDIGATAFGTHRVAGENYRFGLSKPDDRTCLPLAGVAHALARLPEALAAEMMFGGRILDRAEAFAAGLVTHCVAADEFPAIIAALADGQPVDPLLDARHTGPEPQPRTQTVAHADNRVLTAVEVMLQGLLDAARGLDVRDSLVETYRTTQSLHQAGSAIEKQISRYGPVGFHLPLRSEIENGRF